MGERVFIPTGKVGKLIDSIFIQMNSMTLIFAPWEDHALVYFSVLSTYQTV